MGEGIIKTIKEKGLLLEKEIYDLVHALSDEAQASEFLEQIERISGQKFITKSVLIKNVEYVKSFVGKLPGKDKNIIESVFINLGLNLEVRRESEVLASNLNKELISKKKSGYKVFYTNTSADKKIEVADFVGYFRARFQQLQRILMARPELQKNLVSMGKISSERASISVIGIVTEKNITKNKNMILTLEDLTGSIKALVRFDNIELFNKAEEIQLDDVIGLRASGNRDILFVYDVFFSEAFIYEKTKFEEDYSMAFISDTHCGSYRHLGKSFNKFLDWLNSDESDAKKIKYIFIAGDTVDGVGVFPSQEEFLDLKSMEEQYALLASYLKKIPSRITIFLCPGQHDAVRVAEPQPIVSKRYAYSLYEIENVVLVTNPAVIKLYEGDKEFKVLMYHGDSLHTFINGIRELREMKASTCPAKAAKYILKHRHLAPTHSEAIYIPNIDFDPLVISEVPDILCTGEMHHLDIENYNNILIITGSCWQAQTPFEEKLGNVPDYSKVPVFNLKTRELKIFDFADEEEIKQKILK